MSETEKPKSWRDVITIHPACDLFPTMSPDELKALGENIARNGMTAPIVWWTDREADIERTPSPQYQLIDGRNRLDAMEMIGIKVIDFNGREPVFHNMVLETARCGERTSAYEYVLSANVYRRHLTVQQRLDLLDRVTKANPSISSRRVAKLVGMSPTTAAKSRHKLEATGDVSTVDTSTDTKGRQQPTHRARRTADAPHAVELVEPKQSDLGHVLPDADRLVREIMVRDAATPGYALAVARSIAAKLADFPDMPDMLKHETTAPDAHA